MKATFTLLVFLNCIQVIAQNQIGINQQIVDPSAVLELNSTSKGILIPRVSSTQKLNISNPARALFIFENNTRSFWYYNSTSWTKLLTDNAPPDGIADSDADTRIFLDRTNDNDQIQFRIKGILKFRMNANRFDVSDNGNSIFLGDSAGFNDDMGNNLNLYIGSNSGKNGITSSRNIGIGYDALKANIGGSNNVAIGNFSQSKSSLIDRNTAIGINTLLENLDADNLVVIGNEVLKNHQTNGNLTAVGIGALKLDVSGENNTVVGNNALGQNITHNSIVALGYRAGGVATGSSNIYLGYESGALNSSFNKLFIDNTSTANPLIYGNFTNNEIEINGSLRVNEDIYYVGNLTDVSDKRLKKKIKKVTDVLPKLRELNGYRYNLKSLTIEDKEYGLIAQEVQKILPSLSRNIEAEKDLLGVSYVQFIPLILEAEKEQYVQLKSLKKEENEIEKEIGDLAKEIQILIKSVQERQTTSSINTLNK